MFYVLILIIYVCCPWQVKVGLAMTDLCTGLHAQAAILAALYHQLKTGKGQFIECSLLEAQISSLTYITTAYTMGGPVETS